MRNNDIKEELRKEKGQMVARLKLFFDAHTTYMG